MPLVVANDVEHHVQVLGQGPPVVMAHGLITGSLATWFYTTAPALAATHQVMLYDLRGHGRSARTSTGYDTETLVNDLAALTQSIAEPMTLVGHSYGALIALKYALQYPEKVARLVLVETPLPPSQMSEFTQFLQQTPETMINALPAGMQSLFRSQQGSRRTRRLLEALQFLITECSLVSDLMAETDLTNDQLASIQCDVLAIHGTESTLRSVGTRLANHIDHCSAVELPGGHYLPMEAAQELTDTIVGYCCG